jgi:chemotaxis protein MotB
VPKARGKREAPEAEGPSKAWLDSYADAITLLCCFFIMLYAFSLVDAQKFIDFKIGVSQAFGKPNPTIDGGLGLLEAGNGVATTVAGPPVDQRTEGGGEGEGELAKEVTRENAEEIAQEIREQIAAVGASELVQVSTDPRGIIIRFDSQVLFNSGEALILPDGVVVLDTVAPVLDRIDNLLVVEGHTDSIPTDGDAFPTNWELSTTRATNVLRYLVELKQLPAARVSASGYADTRPLRQNSTEDGRQANRRVEIIVIVAPFAESIGNATDLTTAASGGESAGVQAETIVGTNPVFEDGEGPQ